MSLKGIILKLAVAVVALSPALAIAACKKPATEEKKADAGAGGSEEVEVL